MWIKLGINNSWRVLAGVEDRRGWMEGAEECAVGVYEEHTQSGAVFLGLKDGM